MRWTDAGVAVLALGVMAPVCVAGDAGEVFPQPRRIAKVQGYASQRVVEKLDRGLVALRLPGGKTYLSWRLLQSDPPEIAFNVYRVVGGASTKLSVQPVRQTTDFIDSQAPGVAEVGYVVRALVAGQEGAASPVSLASNDPANPYLSIKLQGNYMFRRIGIADLDGDGRLDYVIKQPYHNLDPANASGSPDTFKLEAYRADGRFLWRHDLGWAIEAGVWYSPFLVYDFDGDGRAEVAAKTGEGDPRDKDGRVRTGPEYLTIFDGQTGTPIAQTDWPSRDPWPLYGRYSRNQLGMAYLDGKTPCLIVARGTYDHMTAIAYEFHGGKLRELWRWHNGNLPKEFQGQGAHWMHCADLDGDGRDEVVLGSIALDDDGSILWCTGLGHPDHVYVGDIDPQRPGLEVYFGIETRRPDGNGMCLADAKTGKILWGLKQPTYHVHGKGMCSDIDAAHPGSECYSAEHDWAQSRFARLHTCEGEVITTKVIGGVSPRSARWDADSQRELIQREMIQGKFTQNSFIVNYGEDEPLAKIEGTLLAVVDVLGDWREEILTSVNGELRIYTTSIPARDRRVCLFQDPIYRMNVAHAAMGYYQEPMLSYDLASRYAD